jgi:hypothetical protein
MMAERFLTTTPTRLSRATTRSISPMMTSQHGRSEDELGEEARVDLRGGLRRA